MSITSFERHPLLFGPSPVHRLQRLTAHLGGADVWAKREDCNSGIAYGGNKTRKLEYLVADARPRGATPWARSAGGPRNKPPPAPAAAPRGGRRAGPWRGRGGAWP